MKWLNTANKALGQRKPIELLKFRTGNDLVRNLLGQIQYGIVA
ncbi:MAG: antitoxin Xre/MbcA/ParS toxin-binding domain-containing protein [Desulfobacterales bacterium]